MKEYKFKINGKDYEVLVEGIADGKASVKVNGTPYTVDLPAAGVADKPSGPQEAAPSPSHRPQSAQAASPSASRETAVCAPLPGTILKLCASEGQRVTRGRKLAVIEAMKMENEILAPKDGIVKEVFVMEGDSILEGEKIAIIE